MKKSTGILATAILIVMISGLLLANQMIDYLENNITTDYTAGRGVDGAGKRERLYGHAL